MDKFYETDMYEPLKSYFESRGYTMNAEVCGCDAIAESGGSTIVIEMKKSFSLKLLYQLIDRQGFSNNLYAAVSRPKSLAADSYKNMLKLLKRLNIGLILIDLKSSVQVQVVFEPEIKGIKDIKGRRGKKIMKELSLRSTNLNTGGSHQKKIVTAYRENAVKIAFYMAYYGMSSIKELKNAGCGSKTASILQNNFYGWFRRAAYGKYILSDTGMAILEAKEYEELIKYYKSEVEKTNV